MPTPLRKLTRTCGRDLPHMYNSNDNEQFSLRMERSILRFSTVFKTRTQSPRLGMNSLLRTMTLLS